MLPPPPNASRTGSGQLPTPPPSRPAAPNYQFTPFHVTVWCGDYDKLAMTRMLFSEVFHVALDAVRETVVFAGDSPNDAPMFDYFPNAVGVANLADFTGRLDAEPAWITARRGGHGFAELAEAILEAHGP